MTREITYHFADFTRANYRRLLTLAKQRYVFRFFDSFLANEQFVLWRHDVDFSMHAAARLAVIEHEEGVGATYFAHFHNEFYNLLERDVSLRLRTILKNGHRIGLHFDPYFYEGSSRDEILEVHLPREKQMLEDLIGCPVLVFSFHRPTEWMLELRDLRCAGMINAYAEYFRKEVAYCSDSNGYWRHDRLEDVLRAGNHPRLQVLTHPNWWQDEVMSPRQRIERAITGRAQRTRDIYAEILRNSGREDIDW